MSGVGCNPASPYSIQYIVGRKPGMLRTCILRHTSCVRRATKRTSLLSRRWLQPITHKRCVLSQRWLWLSKSYSYVTPSKYPNVHYCSSNRSRHWSPWRTPGHAPTDQNRQIRLPRFVFPTRKSEDRREPTRSVPGILDFGTGRGPREQVKSFWHIR